MASPKNDPTADPTTAAAVVKKDTITVRGPENGRWRAGLHFGPTPLTVELDTLTKEQLEAIANDPLLSFAINKVNG